MILNSSTKQPIDLCYSTIANKFNNQKTYLLESNINYISKPHLIA
jgi:hypothetical protein